jgi:hypothetical protein
MPLVFNGRRVALPGRGLETPSARTAKRCRDLRGARGPVARSITLNLLAMSAPLSFSAPLANWRHDSNPIAVTDVESPQLSANVAGSWDLRAIDEPETKSMMRITIHDAVWTSDPPGPSVPSERQGSRRQASQKPEDGRVLRTAKEPAALRSRLRATWQL